MGVAVVSCNDKLENDTNPSKNFSEELPVAPDFDWNTMKKETIVLSETSSVYTVIGTEKTLVAENIPAGTYSFTISKGATLEAAQSVEKRSTAQEENCIYFPAKDPTKYGMIMAEDLFPNLGDLDLNDVVVYFRVKYIMDPSYVPDPDKKALVNAVEITIKPAAAGGTIYENIGVATQLILPNETSSPIKNVSGQDITGTGLFAEGVENDFVVPLTDNFRSLFIGASKGGANIINTYAHLPKYDSEEIVTRIDFNKGLDFSSIQPMANATDNGLDFFIVLGDRGREVHPKGHPATSKLSAEYQKYSSYASEPENWVWMLILPNQKQHAREGIHFYDAYPLFKEWVMGNMDDSEGWSYYPVEDRVY